MSTIVENPGGSPLSRAIITGAFGFIIAALVCVSYVPALKAPFVFDSKRLATDPAYRAAPPIWNAIVNNSRSLVHWTFAKQYQSTGPSPFAYHAFNIAIHIAAAWTLFGIARRTLQLPRIPELFNSNATGLAFAIAIVWALHPLQTQAVTYTIQRYESMMALFYLLTLYLFLRGTQSTHSLIWYAAAAMACFAGMTCKSIMVTAPFVVLLFDYCVVSANWKELLRKRWWVHAILIAIGLWGVYLERFVFVTQANVTTAGLSLRSITPWEYLRTQPEILLHYVRLAFWPSTLCIDYEWPVQNSPLRYMLGGLVVVGCLLISIWAAWRRSVLGFLGLSIFVVLAPSSSFIPILDLAFEHRFYLPLAPLAALAICGAFFLTHRWLQDRQARLVLLLGCLVFVVAALSLRTAIRNRDYADPERLWTKAAQVNPRNSRPYNHLGELAREKGDHNRALQMYQQALRINPNSFAAHVNVAMLLEERDREDDAIKHCLAAARILPHQPIAYLILGKCYEAQRRDNLAIDSYRKALDRNPNYAAAHNNLGMLLIANGDKGKGIAHLQQAVAADSRDFVAIVNLGNALRENAEWSLARRQYENAIRVNPYYAPAYTYLGESQAHDGETMDAIESMREAIRLAPKWPEAKLRLSTLLATSEDAIFRNGPLAVDLAKQAVSEESPLRVETLEALAVAYAANQQYEDAQVALERAISVAKSSNAQAVRRLEERLSDYRRRSTPK